MAATNKIRILVTPNKDKKAFKEFSENASKLECNDNSETIFSKIYLQVFEWGENTIQIADDQWIVINDERVCFAVTGGSTDVLVDFAAEIAKLGVCVRAIWAQNTTKLTYTLTRYRESYKEEGIFITSANMGEAFFPGNGKKKHAFFYAPKKNELKRQKEYYDIVWDSCQDDGSDIEEFMEGFSLGKMPKINDCDERTYPCTNIIDDYGNFSDIEAQSFIDGHISLGSTIYALPVRRMLLEGKSLNDFSGCFITVYPKTFQKFLARNGFFKEPDYLYCDMLSKEQKDDKKSDQIEGFLLDKNGNKITSLADFDHAVAPDGEIYYPVPETDFDDGVLSQKAEKKWRKFLNLNNTEEDEFFCYTNDKTEIITAVNKKIKNAIIPDDIKRIRANAFKNCTELRTIELPESLCEIGSCVFMGCSSLESIKIPDSVTIIEENRFVLDSGLFNGCSSLKEVILGHGIKKIPSETFKDCTSLKAITIPKSVTDISTGSFIGCNALSEINVEEGNTAYCSKDGVLYSADGKSLLYCPDNFGGVLEILDTVTTIENTAIAFHDKITKVILPPNLLKLFCDECFGDFALCNEALEIIFTNDSGWYGTNDYDFAKSHKGGIRIAPDKLQNAIKRFDYLYHKI